MTIHVGKILLPRVGFGRFPWILLRSKRNRSPCSARFRLKAALNVSFSRRALATQAMHAAAATRAKARLDQGSPICVFGLCETLGVTVRFNSINMEGMYQRGARPRIHLSARRPLSRRAFNCAHELGHHVFAHGSSIDELRENAKVQPREDPKEFLADTFAGFTLMPVIGLRRAGGEGHAEDGAALEHSPTLCGHLTEPGAPGGLGRSSVVSGSRKIASVLDPRQGDIAGSRLFVGNACGIACACGTKMVYKIRMAGSRPGKGGKPTRVGRGSNAARSIRIRIRQPSCRRRNR